jgi:hypothetical protein
MQVRGHRQPSEREKATSSRATTRSSPLFREREPKKKLRYNAVERV